MCIQITNLVDFIKIFAYTEYIVCVYIYNSIVVSVLNPLNEKKNLTYWF